MRVVRLLLWVIPLASAAGCADNTPAPAPANGGNAQRGPAVPAAPQPGASAEVGLVQCRFEEVAAAIEAARGKVVLVDVWARWCPPCIAGFPHFVETADKYRDQGLVCMTVSLDSGRKMYGPDQVLSFLKDKGARGPNFYLTDTAADDAKMHQAFGPIAGIPYKVLYDRNGNKVWDYSLGRVSDDALEKQIVAELAK